jgi:hypothetical protein
LTYSQTHAQFTWQGKKYGHPPSTYSGSSKYHNNPDKQCLKDNGPLPRGKYKIGKYIAHNHKLGWFVLPLTPDASNSMCGRGHFYIHGDNKAKNYTASEGCIITTRAIRNMIVRDKIKELEVVR